MKRIFIIAVSAIAVFILLALVLLSSPGVDSLKVSMVSHSTDTTNVEVKVTNTSRRIVNFAFWVEVLKDGKWVRDDLWYPKMEGRLHWIAGHDSQSIQLPAPADSTTWRFKIMGEEQPTALKWKWLSFGKKIGLKSEPRQWYIYLDSDK
jgi:archaellum component FlaF (FlaF/FlaG flagellin family)